MKKIENFKRMKTDILFQEVQKQNQKWIWFLVIILICLAVFAFIQQVILKKPFGNHPMPDWGFAIFLGVPLLLFFMLVRTELRTSFSGERLSFSYRPFFKKEKIIRWEEVDRCYVRLYSPFREFGGWGVRTAFNGKNGKAYNVAGNKGIQLELKDGSRVLIGTQKAREAEAVLRQIKAGI